MPKTHGPLVLLALLLAGGVWAERIEAQASPPVQVQGTVLDHVTNEPLEGVTVVARDAFGDVLARRTTGPSGGFAFEVRNRPGIRIRASRIGYREVNSPYLSFENRDLFVIELHLDTEAVPLAPLTVVARSESVRSPVLGGFDRRAETGFGWYFTRDEIEEIGPMMVSDLLGRVPGVRLESGGRGGHRRTVTMARATIGPGGGPCPVQIFLDGRPITRGSVMEVAVDDLVTPEALEGLEVYRGLSSVPAEFLTPESRCGVVAIWTRRGGS